VTTYSERANGNVPPITRIAGPHTRLFRPLAVAVSSGRIWVAGTYARLLRFHRNDTGDVSPAGKIHGVDTKLFVPYGIAVSSSGIYVANQAARSIARFATNAEGDAPPIALIVGPNTDIEDPRHIALDPLGDIYVADTHIFKGAILGAILEFAAGANGDTPPIRVITGPDTGLGLTCGIALDSTGEILVSNNPNRVGGEPSITVYAPSATGDAPPIRTILGSDTELTGSCGIAVDSTKGIIFASNPGSITSYPLSANGDVAPMTVISGSNTELDNADDVALAHQ
jgi:hypothetical protein